jgi:hypothetical protein
MTATASAPQLRDRAAHLRALADAIEAMPAMSLDRYAGDDTWRGPRPLLCSALLAAAQRRLHRAADDLRWSALRLDEQAASLDAASGAT